MNTEFESYMVGIAKKYMQDHPEKNIKLMKQVEIPVDCDFCNGKEIIPFSDNTIQVVADKIEISCSCGRKVCENINFCPKCGRKLN